MVRHASLTVALFTALLPSLAQAAENRCGWVTNPTPRNWWLEDKDRSWTLMTQASEEPPEGMGLVMVITAGDFVSTDGDYGYACGCMKVDTDGKETITKIYSFKQLKLAQCRKDKAIKDKE